VRLFLAINLEPELRRAVADATAPLRAAAPSPSWVDESKIHLTLKFLGEQDESVVPPLSAAMDRVVANHRRFSMKLGHIGAFPNFRRARVVWMGIEHEPRLELLHHDVELACETLGFELEGRPFRPHLTLARVNKRTEVEEMRQLSRAGKRVTFQEDAIVESLDLMQSTLGGSHPSRYQRLHAATLRTS
jgi:2'-5' RNA ligase